ncbi:amino acid kinase family protein [Chitinimonas sp. BJB300]|uniref:amino acid kinase family protein n=1 Tax=Chitinimonas sp. BJB300 TaxID=1559339 RepID=UPI000C0E3481|nr:acetylglutamate kinase [Chitinimonas sp. BJB300]PHV13475.1 acetylglutamate kinase [Chitinimonas sp. BJB300]TSJ89840.1 acetylglutamate kinase [Chitinimonas sp. BJB300]
MSRQSLNHFTGKAIPQGPAQSSIQACQASLLASALPFVQALQQQTVVIVYTGSTNHDISAKQAFAQQVALLAMTGMRPIVVHGGAPQFQPCQAGGRAPVPEWVAMRVARAGLADLNLDLVHLISQYGPKAMGVTGQDGHCLLAASHAENGAISPIAKLDTGLFTLLQNDGMVPVVMPMAPDADGEDRLLSPERLGALLAQQLQASTLVLMGDGTSLLELTGQEPLNSEAELAHWLAMHPTGVAAHLASAALDALGHGVQSVHFVDACEPHALITALLTEEGCGLILCRRNNAQLMKDSTRYFHDCDSVLRPDFHAERKRVVRF